MVEFQGTLQSRTNSVDVTDISVVYDNDTILQKTTSRYYSTWHSDAVKYILSGNKVVAYADAFIDVVNGKTSTFFYDTINCVYENGNVLNCSNNHNFEYDERFYNPYLTLGNHVWYLLSESWDIAFGESENMLSIDSYIQTPPPTPSETTYEVLSAFEGNKLLPHVVKQKYSNGSEFVYTYSYMKKN